MSLAKERKDQIDSGQLIDIDSRVSTSLLGVISHATLTVVSFIRYLFSGKWRVKQDSIVVSERLIDLIEIYLLLLFVCFL